MPSQKIVRCLLRPVGSKAEPSPRYVPLEIYGLWEFLMCHKHGFEVLEPRASLWLDAEDAPDTAYSDDQYDRVTEVTAFVYSSRDDMFTRACRYFPSHQCDRLKELFLQHYQGEHSRMTHIRERHGLWLHREVVMQSEPSVARA